MSIIEKHIQAVSKAANNAEDHILKTENIPAKELVKLSKELLEYVNTINVLSQLKAANDQKQSRIIKM